MNKFLIVLFAISISGSILFLFFLLLDKIYCKFKIVFQNETIKLVLLIFVLLAIGIPIFYLINISPVTLNVRGEDIRSWTSFINLGEHVFTQRIYIVSILIFSIWLIGFILVSTKTVIRNINFITQMHILAKEEKDLNLQEVKHKIATELHIKKDIKIFRSNLIISPCISGILVPRIYLPMNDFTDIEINLLLKHEMYHYKRRDILYNILITILYGIYWFNPIIRIFIKKLYDFCELSCDQYVLNNASKKFRTIYAELLIHLSEEAINKKKYGLTTFISQDEVFMKRRIYNIMRVNGKINKFILLAEIIFVINLCPITIYASAIGTTQFYNHMLSYASLNSSEEKLNQNQVNYWEKQNYVNSLNLKDSIYIDTKGTNPVDMKILKGGTGKSSSFKVAKGGTIKVFISTEKSTDKFRAVIKLGKEEIASGTSDSGDVNYTYNVETSDYYTVSIINLSSNSIHVSGSIIVNQ